jgi:hypothetical protein
MPEVIHEPVMEESSVVDAGSLATKPQVVGQPAAVPPPTNAPVPLWFDGTPYDPDRAKAFYEQSREREKHSKAVEAENQRIRKALGVDKTASSDPIELAADLETARAETVAAQAEIRALQINGAVNSAVLAAGGHPQLATGYMTGMKLLDGLDPSDAGFEKSLAAIVKNTLEHNPALKLAGQVPPVSGTPFPAGSGGDTSVYTQDKLATMHPQEIHDAKEAGKLRHLGIAPDQTH